MLLFYGLWPLNDLLLNNQLQQQYYQRRKMQQNHVILNNSLYYYPIFYQPTMYMVNNNFMPLMYKNPLAFNTFCFNLQNNQNQNFTFNANNQNQREIGSDLTQYQRIQSLVEEKSENMKKVRKIKVKTNMEQQFLINQQIKKTGVTYKKKNTESNLMNQTFSYIRDQNSMKMVKRILNHDVNKINQYYKLINKIKKQNKKYINRKLIKRLMDFEKRTEFYRVFDKCKLTHLSIDQARMVLRKLVFLYLRNSSYCTLLTSSKIYKDTLHQHFWRKRQIFEYLFPNVNQ